MHIDSFAGDVGEFGELLTRTDWRDFTHPSTAIVETTAEMTDRPFDELPPLQTYIDVDSLDHLLLENSETAAVSFVYDQVVVNVAADGRLELWTR